jgi:hypothetical protein
MKGKKFGAVFIGHLDFVGAANSYFIDKNNGRFIRIEKGK